MSADTSSINITSFAIAAGHLQGCADRLGPPPHTGMDDVLYNAARLGVGVLLECKTPDDALFVARQFACANLKRAFLSGLSGTLQSPPARASDDLVAGLRPIVADELAKLTHS